jgi:membrane-associated phospholipid phosphatase
VTEFTEIEDANRLIWWVIGTMVALVCAGSQVTGVWPDILSGWKSLSAIGVCLAIAYLYRRWRPDPWISLGAEAVAQVALILILGILLSYVVAAAAFPYRDAELHAIDEWLGFGSIAYLSFFNRHPFVAHLISFAYSSIKLQTLFVLGALIVSSRFARVQEYLLAVAIGLSITVAVFTFVPAVDIYTFFHLSQNDFPNLSFAPVFDHIAPLAAVRDGTSEPINFETFQGLITFPSFHTTSAILFTWAVFPLTRIRWWIVAVNVLMVIAAPVDGGHYFIDVIGGSMVACLAIVAAAHLRKAYLRMLSAHRPSPTHVYDTIHDSGRHLSEAP